MMGGVGTAWGSSAVEGGTWGTPGTHTHLRGILDPVLVLQDGLDVGVGDDHIVQLQL